MPERDASVAERELAADAATETLPVDSGFAVPMAAAEAGDEGVARKKLPISAWIALGWIVALFVACLLAPLLPIPEATARVDDVSVAGCHVGSKCSKLSPFASPQHPLGTDNLGRDMVSRLVYGARNSLFIGVASIIIGMLLGGFIGLVSGYFRGRTDSVLMGMSDVLLSIPALILALSLSIFLQPRVADIFDNQETAGRMTLTFVFGLVSIPTLARITRANTLVWSQREFVTAARAQGAKNFRIMFREVLPNVIPAMLAIALLGVAVVVIAEASLSLLGAGITPPAPTWGNIIYEGKSDFAPTATAPHMVFESAVFIFLTVLSFNYLGDAIRARFDVREARI